jgi:3-oxoacyl-[acyl-carrier protein] reductase
MDLDLKGKTALVTGASRGIGRAIATLLTEEGCNLVLVARDRDGLKTLSSELMQRAAVSVEFEACDLSQAGAPERLAAKFPAVDILVNNAGAVPPGKLEELPVEQIREGWTLKVFGYLGMMRTYFPVMTSRVRASS